ncbi:hypothetical protein [Alicyclobacillus sp. SO9]|uniref:hypothetical protein n=1 Tax=Alicyclobacillus sp. SO9 TaxID=2665646 RepID=UPI0018E815C9|nr:hypothetical protein [Alicyclobacillus sp. SO9]QQE78071.1 hypothetical protein GI364_19580 [Alicyclobacillus sp. SO9]
MIVQVQAVDGGPGLAASDGVEDKRLRNAYLQHLGVEAADSDRRGAYRRPATSRTFAAPVLGAGGRWGAGLAARDGVEDKRLRNAYLQHLGVEAANSDPRRAYRRRRYGKEGCGDRISTREELNSANSGIDGEIAIPEELIGVPSHVSPARR